MAHCITIAVEDFSSKILQQEQNEQTSATCYVMRLINVQHMKESWGVVGEEEQPKQIAKACIKKSTTHQISRLSLLFLLPWNTSNINNIVKIKYIESIIESDLFN